MLAHSTKSQAEFVGIRSTFYRVASIFGQGVLVYIAGAVEKSSGNIPYSWQVSIGTAAAVFFAVTLYHTFFLPKPDADEDRSAASEGVNKIKEFFFRSYFEVIKIINILFGIHNALIFI